MGEQPVCLWCQLEVSEWGDTCDLTCYQNVGHSLTRSPYLRGEDVAPKDLYLQPWAEGMLNTQEG